MNRVLSAVILVVEMLKNSDFQGSYGIFSKTSIRKIKLLKTYVCGVWVCVKCVEVCVSVCVLL